MGKRKKRKVSFLDKVEWTAGIMEIFSLQSDLFVSSFEDLHIFKKWAFSIWLEAHFFHFKRNSVDIATIILSRTLICLFWCPVSKENTCKYKDTT